MVPCMGTGTGTSLNYILTRENICSRQHIELFLNLQFCEFILRLYPQHNFVSKLFQFWYLRKNLCLDVFVNMISASIFNLEVISHVTGSIVPVHWFFSFFQFENLWDFCNVIVIKWTWLSRSKVSSKSEGSQTHKLHSSNTHTAIYNHDCPYFNKN
jgi:hypothetical protein